MATLDQIAKRKKDKDYHSEKVLSGDPKKGDYNIAISGKKGGERYSKSLRKSKKGKQLERTITSTRKSKTGKEKGSRTFTSYIKQTTSKSGKDHTIKSKTSSKRKRLISTKKRLPVKKKKY